MPKVIIIEIDFSKCPSFKNTLIEVGSYADLSYQIQPTRKGIAGYKKYMSMLIKDSLKRFDELLIELFGVINYEDEEKQEKQYLLNLIK